MAVLPAVNPVELTSLDHVVAVFTVAARNNCQPVGGNMAASNPSVNGRTAPTGADVIVKFETELLFAVFKSVPEFGAVTHTEKVCGAVVNPVKAFSVNTVDVELAKEPDQLSVCVAAASILYNILALVNVTEPAFNKVTLGVILLIQVEEPFTGVTTPEIAASRLVTGVQPFDVASTFHGAVLTTASIRAHCWAVNIYIDPSSL